MMFVLDATGFDRLDKRRHDLMTVTHDSILGVTENRRPTIGIYRNNGLGVYAPSHVLAAAGNTDSHIEFRSYSLSRQPALQFALGIFRQ